MRVSDKVLYNTITNNLQQNLEKILGLQEEISSGKRINRPSDDPAGVMKVIDYDTAISRVRQYQRNIDNISSSLGVTESAISSTQDILLRAKELALTALNGTNTAADRSIIAKEVEELYQQVIQIANTRFGGRYIFAGYNIDTEPYESDGSYAGTLDTEGGDIDVEIDAGSTVPINIPGYRVFGPSSDPDTTDILAALSSLGLAIENSDVQEIENEMVNIDSGMDQLNNILSEVGARMNRLEMAKSYYDKLEIDLIEYKSETEDADITQVITELAMQQNALEVSRASVARVLQQSLLDFLR